MSTGMRKWMEKGCPEIQCLPAQVSIDREELKQLRDHLEAAEKDVALKEQVIDALGSELNAVANERDAMRAMLRAALDVLEEVKGNINPERGYADELEADVERAIATIAIPGAQPAQSIPDGWLRAIDEALVVAHIGVANASDTYEQAKAKLDSLIGFHVDAATDPAVNGGWKLVPRPPTPTMVKAGLESSHVLNVHRVLACYDAMIDAAPEAKL